MKLIRPIVANAAFFACMLLLVAIVGTGTTYTLNRLERQALDSQLEIGAMYAAAFEGELSQHFRLIDFALKNLHEDLAEGNKTPSRNAALLESALKLTPALRSLSVLDAHKQIVASTNPANVGTIIDGKDFLPPASPDRDFLRIDRTRSGRDVGKIWPAIAGEKLRGDLPLSFIPVLSSHHGNGRLMEMLATINPDFFINSFGQKIAPHAGFIEVLRYDGTLLFTSETPHPTGNAHRAAFFTRHFNEQEFGSLRETLPDKTATLTAFRASSHYPFLIVVRLYENEALQRWRQERALILTLAPPALLAVVVLASLLYFRQRNISRRRRDEEQRRHERLAAAVFATVDQAVMVTDADNAIIEINPAFTTITGYTAAEAIGQNPRILSSGAHPAEFFAAMYRSLSETGSWHGEIRNRHKDGRQYVEWLSIRQVRDDQGNVQRHVAAFSDISDRKAAEEAQLHAVLEASPEGALLVAESGDIVFANRVCESMLGYSPEELIGMNVDQFVPPALRTLHRQHRQDFASRPQSRPMMSGIRLFVLRRDGSSFPAEISLSPIRSGDDRLVIASINDITRRIEDEEALRSSEERWKFALEGAGEGVWDWNIAKGSILFSRQILGFWKLDNELQQQPLDAWLERIHPDDRALFSSDLQAHLQDNSKAFSVEIRCRTSDEQWIWILCRGKVVSHDGDGNATRMIGTCADIGRRKKIEADFQDLLEFNQAVIATSHAGIMVHKPDGECVLANEAAARIAGTEAVELRHHNFRTLPSWQTAGIVAIADRVLSSGQSEEFESRLSTSHGKEIWCVASFGRISLNGKIFLLSVINDISARKETEVALVEAKEHAEGLIDRARLAERRIVDISEETLKRVGQELHDDLGQHLTGAAFLSETLHQKLKCRNAVETVDSASITELINEAVSKTRDLAQGLYPVALKEGGLRPLLEQMARNTENIYKIRCHLTCDPGLEISDFDIEINLFRIAQEAIGNAIKHGKASEIGLTLTSSEEMLIFEIADNGCGLPSSAEHMQGRGLGMHTMHYRAQLIGAALDITSHGSGAIVSLRLPGDQK